MLGCLPVEISPARTVPGDDIFRKGFNIKTLQHKAMDFDRACLVSGLLVHDNGCLIIIQEVNILTNQDFIVNLFLF